MVATEALQVEEVHHKIMDMEMEAEEEARIPEEVVEIEVEVEIHMEDDHNRDHLVALITAKMVEGVHHLEVSAHHIQEDLALQTQEVS